MNNYITKYLLHSEFWGSKNLALHIQSQNNQNYGLNHSESK